MTGCGKAGMGLAELLHAEPDVHDARQGPGVCCSCAYHYMLSRPLSRMDCATATYAITNIVLPLELPSDW